jgi:hypothetical protein
MNQKPIMKNLLNNIKFAAWYALNTNFGRLILASAISVISGIIMGQFHIINFFTQFFFYSGFAYLFGWFLVSLYFMFKNTFFNKDK